MKAVPTLIAALLAAAVLPNAAHGGETAATDSPKAPVQIRLLPASDLLLPSTWVDDAGLRLLRHRALLGLTAEQSPALRFGATRFAAEGPWADISFRRDDGRVLRLWLVDDAGPPPLLGDERDPWDMQLRWSLTKKK